ncbi:hypothetical protein [Marinobacter sp.]|uniref:hypothetical protein n=1 Tax=Marinobacter sp. TaxID=50741 RepID=UPI003A9115E5
MKPRFPLTTIAALTATLVYSGGSYAAKGGVPGPPDGGGGGKPPTTDVYADMVIIDRDVNGVPITTLGVGPGDSPAQVPQPIMLGPKATADICPLWYEGSVPMIPPLIAVEPPSVYSELGIEAYRIPMVDGEIPELYAGCTTEADLGRLSVVRSTDSVLDSALAEMVTTLSEVDGEEGESITLDAAGRLVANYRVDDVLIEKIIDAPGENLAAFQRILEETVLYHADVNGGVPIELPGSPSDAQGLLARTAPLLAAASDKFSHVGLDELIYVTQILTIGTDMNSDATSLFGAPWGGNYVNFSEFSYDRSTTYDGDLCFLEVTSIEPGDALPIDITGQIVKRPIMEMVFDNVDFSGNNAYGYAKAVDDARAIILWAHEHPVQAELLYLCDLP